MDETIFHRFYGRDVLVNGEENCGNDRRSVDRSGLLFNKPDSLKYRIKYCDILPLKNIENILGPITYREYSKDDVNIFLFGENHSILEDCHTPINNSITFAGFLKSLLSQRSNTFYDFYLEHPYHYSSRRASDKSVNMNLIEDAFGRFCLSKVKKCPYENVRMHYIDYRHGIENKTIEKLTGKYIEFLYDQKQPTEDDLSFKTYEKYMTYIQEFIETDTRLQKQLQDNRKIIMDFLYIYMAKIRINTRRKDVITVNDFLDVFTIIMDVYALGRMFRTFNLKEHEKMPSKPQNIIIYVGDYHANVYDDFFVKHLHFDRRLSIQKNGTSCLHFSKLNKLMSLLFRPQPKLKLQLQPQPTKSKIPLPQQLPTEVYNPYYKRLVPIYGEENCFVRESVNTDIKYKFAPFDSSYRNRVLYCDVLPLSVINKILGPVSYREYERGDTTICLFGESHLLLEHNQCKQNLRNSITFAGFLKSLLTQKRDTFFDFYVELFYKHNYSTKKYISDDYVNMNLIVDAFHECLGVVKTCPYNNTRMHYVDYRSNSGFENQQFTLDTEDSVFDELQRVKRFILTDKRLNDQINKTYIGRDVFMDYLDDYFIKTVETLLTTKKVHFLATYIYTAIMDIYTLSRMFRNFSDRNKDMPTEQKNIIIYVGNYHANMYDDFFVNYAGFTRTINIPETNSSCLKFTEENKKNSFLFTL